MHKWFFVAGVAVGYVLGARAGRARYEQIAGMARRVRDNPTVRSTAGTLQTQAGQLAGVCRDKLMSTDVADRWFGSRKTAFTTDGEKPRYWETVGVNTPSRDSNVDRNEIRDL